MARPAAKLSLSEERRCLDAADGADLSSVQKIPDGKLPGDPGTGKIDTSDLDGATLTASDLRRADIAGRSAGSRFGSKRLDLGPRHIDVTGAWGRQCVPADAGRAIRGTLVTIVVSSSREIVGTARGR